MRGCDLFSGMFYVARNPVTNHHMFLLGDAGRRVNVGDVAKSSPNRKAKRISLRLYSSKNKWREQMALLGVSLRETVLSCADAPATPLALVLKRELSRLPYHAPIVVMIHGYRFSPDCAGRDPHRSLFALAPKSDHWKIKSWPRGLGFSDAPSTGLCIGFGWQGFGARADDTARHDFARAYQAAGRAGAALATLLDLIAEIAPARDVDLFAHSLGARVALSGLARTVKGRIGRVILMGGAEYAHVAGDALQRRPRTPVYNVTARSNRLYDLLFQTFAPRQGPCGRTLGEGLDAPHSHWVNLDFDTPGLARLLAARGQQIGPARSPVCHWGFYLRAGTMPLYRSILRERHLWHPRDLAIDWPKTEAETLPRLHLPGLRRA